MATSKSKKTTRTRATKKRRATKRPKRTLPADLKAQGEGWTLELGQTVERIWHGKTYTLEVVEGGYSVDGAVHRTLTAAAKAVTGAKSISGPLFWGLAKRKAVAK